MDVVLDLFETFIGDHVFALLLPNPGAGISHAANGSFQNLLPCDYEPATKYFSVTPSPAACMSVLPRDNIYRQAINLFLIRWIFGLVIYFFFASLSYIFIFDKGMMKHPKYLRNQTIMEIKQACYAMPGISLLSLPLVLADVRGHSKMYDSTVDGPGLWYNILQIPLFVIFTDFFIYWIHRGLHHPLIYKTIHKPHHKWIIPTPYAAYAFHPVDGFSQALPYDIFPFIFPLQKVAYLALFVFVNFWAILIHDGEYLANSSVINGAACHTIHHLYFNYNYGQYTTLWDRLCWSYREPNEELFQSETKKSTREWQKQIKGAEKMIAEVEGEDDRTYIDDKKSN